MPVQCGYTQPILVKNSLQLTPRVQSNPLFKGMRLGLISSQGALGWGITPFFVGTIVFQVLSFLKNDVEKSSVSYRTVSYWAISYLLISDWTIRTGCVIL